ncbi:Hypothetical protein D9617_62g044180 [Elsinoe fawcettii]|nr:Hypothetical protein D9617_62g044180 [Elsinoe fawcettii]
MRASDRGMVGQDLDLCKTLLSATQETERDPLFDLHFDRFRANLRGRSEARICTDLHPRLAPSVENLFIAGRTKFGSLTEGYNDAWVKSIPFYGPRPQPDHTYGFRWDSFSELQRRKMRVDPQQKSLYTAREDFYFPFLTAEVKCGRQGLDLAERPNMHSMTVAMRGIVDLHRRANRASEVHRRVLGFTISHDDATERIHAYYPETDGEETTYWRKVVEEFAIGSQDGEHRWTSYRFTLNVCEMFALPLLDRLKHVIDELPDPLSQSGELSSNLGDFSVQSSQEEDSIRDGTSRRSHSAGGLGTGFRNTIQNLQQQLLEQQRKAEEQQKRAGIERMRAEEQQQKREEEQQRRFKEQEEKLERLMGMLEEQKK